VPGNGQIIGAPLAEIAMSAAFRTPCGVALSALLACGAAQAVDFQVQALEHSVAAGSGLATVVLAAGDAFSVSVDVGDLWSAGALPRWSNADGLDGVLLATGSDDSGQAAGTQIGANFGLLGIGNLSAPFGTLVGRIGAAGDYFAIGTSFNGVAAASGTLNLFYWDSNSGDNTEFVTASVTVGEVTNPIPEPSTYALMLAGLLATAWVARRRRA
jgi:hypothetical protein